MVNVKENANFIWEIADLLRGDYKQSDYGKVILPLTVLRRLDCVLEPTKQKVLDYLPKIATMNIQNTDPVLNSIAGFNFHNKSKFDFEKLKADPNNIAANLNNYINGFSINAREIIDYFGFNEHISKLDDADLLYMIVKRFGEIDLHPNKVSNLEMGYIFEELIRRFSELSNETAGEHFTPREVIRLMVNLLFVNDKEILTKEGIVRTLYDPTSGTGGMLSISEEYVRELNPDARLEVFGQEVNPESYAICKSDMLIKGQNASNIKFGNSFTNDGLENETFDYMLSNPPFGVEWKKVQKQVEDEHEKRGFGGRFGAGLPRISDGSFLFLQHMISKMKPANGGSRIGIVFNGSPLFTGGAGSGESDIRKWIIENDMLEAIVAMPDQLFYNTGIFTYIWIVTNRKAKERKGKIQLVNAVTFYNKMSRSLGNKRNEIGEGHIETITRMYGDFKENEFSRIYDNSEFGYWQITVERPLRDEGGNIVKDGKGKLKSDANLRDNERVPLKEDIQTYFEREVLPHVPDAWIDNSKTKKGYEINFTKFFYKYKPLRRLSEIRADILALEKETEGLLRKAIE
ncbi:MAG: type I restriction-modification system methyltransferase subunit [Candidatus Methanoperedens nitroreducens]|uniref:site-specific DNA-methyltransferase (adenine-specific) n=1 Tax=Candidatus Methanoperedens nitratireducens TaxID=1392998 RepID=A0A0P8A4R6_9EURY|nr:class I SAM-dependent DNA methyltransferase [Candidatus Methanoperedens sp. BLZ2]KAB2947110.1 MAG: SAM-dependent DNA methyltransferase [Candidatus Methanoperedens sp.]KPQ41492.1 MAG: type I restriction-modification system methyltransferase subunit [Candidatus Methanoperedens sp. BLZ1]MBZ0174207.1 type I restriction-modification system subunit M [Candidatus Methanoperedens nitroreducens]CAG0968821.1 Type I restriction enzyme EcoKI M protein [Methanosarcinales archaeon]MCX9077725.1 class I SA